MAPPSPVRDVVVAAVEWHDAHMAVTHNETAPQDELLERYAAACVQLDEVVRAHRAELVRRVGDGLALHLDVQITKTRRRRCPRCQRVRVLYRLVAFGESPFGEGPLLCGECGGLRG